MVCGYMCVVGTRSHGRVGRTLVCVIIYYHSLDQLVVPSMAPKKPSR